MQFTAQELKEKLLRAIDADNNVVDIQSVLGVLTTLEQLQVTKEQLEQTRIGRIVNDLRRKTNNRELAKRAKSLVRKWRDFINLPTAIVNGDRVVPVGVSAGAEIHVLPPHLQRGAGSKPASPASGPGTPSSGKSTVSPPNIHYVTTTPVSSQPGTPILHSRLSPRLAAPKPLCPVVNAAGMPPGNNTSKHSPPNLVIRQANSPDGATCEVVRPSSPHETVSKVNVANKRKRRGAEQDDAPTKPAKCMLLSDTNSGMSQAPANNGEGKYKKAVNGAVTGEHYSKSGHVRSNISQWRSGVSLDTRLVSPVSQRDNISANHEPEMPKQSLNSSLSARMDVLGQLHRTPSVSSDRSDSMLDKTPTFALRTPKVKTTAELIQDLHSKAGMRLSGNKTVTKIALNQIDKEPDNIADSVVPPGAKPRFRRKPGSAVAPPPSTNKSLIKTKNEMVEKFLQSSVVNEPMDGGVHGLIDMIKQDNERVDNLADVDVELPQEEDSRCSFISVPSQLEPSGVDPWSLLPPLDPDTVDLGDDSYEVPEILPATEADVDRLLTEQWSGVNGQLDYQGSWQDWTQVLSVPSSENNLLHILPYVCLD